MDEEIRDKLKALHVKGHFQFDTWRRKKSIELHLSEVDNLKDAFNVFVWLMTTRNGFDFLQEMNEFLKENIQELSILRKSEE